MAMAETHFSVESAAGLPEEMHDSDERVMNRMKASG